MKNISLDSFEYIAFTKKYVYLKLKNKSLKKINQKSITINKKTLKIKQLKKEFINHLIITNRILFQSQKRKLNSFIFKISKKHSHINHNINKINYINLCYKECVCIESFKFLLGHEFSHFHIQYQMYNKNKILHSLIVFFRHFFSVLFDIIGIVIIALLLSLLIYLMTNNQIKIFYPILSIVFSFYLKILLFNKFTALIFNLKNLSKIQDFHHIEVLCDRFSCEAYNAKLYKFFTLKRLFHDCFINNQSSMSHPNVGFRHLSSLLNKTIIIPAISYENLQNNKEYIDYNKKIKNIIKFKIHKILIFFKISLTTPLNFGKITK